MKGCAAELKVSDWRGLRGACDTVEGRRGMAEKNERTAIAYSCVKCML